jgi:NADH-quinone oxidoreductase subunit I
MSYFGDINNGIKTTLKGLSLTWKHLFDARHTRGPINVEDSDYFKVERGHVTLQYPHETISVPDNGRYQLDCEIDDCIVCDKCAKVCPVDCIDIEAIKSPELIRTTSDGSPVRLHAAKFDIDMAKCCFCGLCTTVCPTECLTMDSEYDFSVWDVDDMNFEFANLTAEVAEEKRTLYNQFVAEKESAKKQAATTAQTVPKPIGNRPAFRPGMKPKVAGESTEEVPSLPRPAQTFRPGMKPPVSKPVFKPTVKPPPPNKEIPDDLKSSESPPRPVGFKPTIKPPTSKPLFKPTAKPPIADKQKLEESEAVVKPAGFRPTIKPPAGKPLFKPTAKPLTKKIVEDETENKPPSKPTGFKPKMKPPKKKDDE